MLKLKRIKEKKYRKLMWGRGESKTCDQMVYGRAEIYEAKKKKKRLERRKMDQ